MRILTLQGYSQVTKYAQSFWETIACYLGMNHFKERQYQSWKVMD